MAILLADILLFILENERFLNGIYSKIVLMETWFDPWMVKCDGAKPFINIISLSSLFKGNIRSNSKNLRQKFVMEKMLIKCVSHGTRAIHAPIEGASCMQKWILTKPLVHWYQGAAYTGPFVWVIRTKRGLVNPFGGFPGCPFPFFRLISGVLCVFCPISDL